MVDNLILLTSDVRAEESFPVKFVTGVLSLFGNCLHLIFLEIKTDESLTDWFLCYASIKDPFAWDGTYNGTVLGLSETVALNYFLSQTARRVVLTGLLGREQHYRYLSFQFGQIRADGLVRSRVDCTPDPKVSTGRASKRPRGDVIYPDIT